MDENERSAEHKRELQEAKRHKREKRYDLYKALKGVDLDREDLREVRERSAKGRLPRASTYKSPVRKSTWHRNIFRSPRLLGITISVLSGAAGAAIATSSLLRSSTDHEGNYSLLFVAAAILGGLLSFFSIRNKIDGIAETVSGKSQAEDSEEEGN